MTPLMCAALLYVYLLREPEEMRPPSMARPAVASTERQHLVLGINVGLKDAGGQIDRLKV